MGHGGSILQAQASHQGLPANVTYRIELSLGLLEYHMYKRGGLFGPRSLAVDRVLEELTPLLDLWLPGEPCGIK